MKVMNRKPLVSIALIAYNHSKYIVETLESIKSQTYSNLELIISDDFSTDNTVDVCTSWLNENKNRFVDARIITSDYNTGVPANLNRAIRMTQGEWVKSVAGDDILIPTCIEKFVFYIEEHPEANIVFSKLQAFYVSENGLHIDVPFAPVTKEDIVRLNSKTAREQYIGFLKNDFSGIGGSPTTFARRSFLISNPYEELYRGFEDVPFLIRVTRSGFHIETMNEITVRYRKGETLTSSKERYFSLYYWESKHLFFWNELINYLREENLYESYNYKRKELLKIELILILTGNKVSFKNRCIRAIIERVVKRIDYPKNGWKGK